MGKIGRNTRKKLHRISERKRLEDAREHKVRGEYKASHHQDKEGWAIDASMKGCKDSA